jgi:hypothetical protein
MKQIFNSTIFILMLLTSACSSDSFINDLFVKPQALFQIDKTEYEVHESVIFTNKGAAQRYVVFPGDSLHKYKVDFNSGYATSSAGTFSYAYNEPGEYNAVWVATSVNESGEVIQDVDSVKIKVVSKNGGLEKLTVYNTYKMVDYANAVFFSSVGEFVSKDTLICPFIFDSWRTSTVVNSLKAPQLINFELASSLSKFYWVENEIEREIKSSNTASRIVRFAPDGKLAVQKFIVKTASGINSTYYVAPLIIPKMTKFSVNGIDGVITRDLAFYNRYNVTISLPANTSYASIVPIFEIMNNDVNLVGNNIEVTVNGQIQVSGSTSVDASSKTIIYKVRSFLLGSTNKKLYQDSYITVKF